MKKPRIKAAPQLQLVPRSDNERRRQSTYQKAVVSLRFSGATINRLDTLAKTMNESEGRHHWNRITRTHLIARAVDSYLAANEAPITAPKKGKTK